MIYQYTSLETLALILKNRTIRFNRLDNLDDPFEKYIKAPGFSPKENKYIKQRKDYGKYCFVSCWTMFEEEIISMWDMYGDRKQGVRIGMPKDMFDKTYNINARPHKTIQLFKTEDIHTLPQPIEVNYNRTDDPELLSSDLRIVIDNLGKYKSNGWEFQKELRFRLYGGRFEEDPQDYYYIADGKEFFLPIPIDRSYVDFPLNEDAIKNLRIIIGPNMSTGKRVLLKSLLKDYGVNKGQVIKSSFTDDTEA